MGINNANATTMCSTQQWVVTIIALSLIAYIFISFRSLQFHLDLPLPPVQTPIKEQRHQGFSEVPKNEASGITNLVFHLADIFNRTYAEMEKKFKVYIYPDGDPKTFYQIPRKLTGKYASKGYFFQNIRESRFRTDNPEEAHLFFIPISCHKMRGKGTSYENMTVIVQNYVESLSQGLEPSALNKEHWSSIEGVMPVGNRLVWAAAYQSKDHFREKLPIQNRKHSASMHIQTLI